MNKHIHTDLQGTAAASLKVQQAMLAKQIRSSRAECPLTDKGRRTCACGLGAEECCP
jgi:hypothetical protein